MEEYSPLNRSKEGLSISRDELYPLARPCTSQDCEECLSIPFYTLSSLDRYCLWVFPQINIEGIRFQRNLNLSVFSNHKLEIRCVPSCPFPNILLCRLQCQAFLAEILKHLKHPCGKTVSPIYTSRDLTCECLLSLYSLLLNVTTSWFISKIFTKNVSQKQV